MINDYKACHFDPSSMRCGMEASAGTQPCFSKQQVEGLKDICGGGQSTDPFDMLAAIRQWVEKGQAPDRLVASGRAFPRKTRPLCPYPKMARFDGGNPDSQGSFSCR
jgi:hypothetical protein